MPSPYLIIAIAAGIIAGLIINYIKHSKNNHMKIYALVYTYNKKDTDGVHDMTRLAHAIGESLEDIMIPAEEAIKKEEGYVPYSLRLSLRDIMPLDSLLDDIKVKLPELVQSAKEREKLTKIAEVLKEYENQS